MSDPTLKELLNAADPNRLPNLLALIALGTMFEVSEVDTGTVSATNDVTLPGGALTIQSIRVVSSGTAGAVGCYIAGDAGATAVNPAGANTQPGVAKLSADGTTLTFASTITRAIVRYTKKPAASLASNPAF